MEGKTSAWCEAGSFSEDEGPGNRSWEGETKDRIKGENKTEPTSNIQYHLVLKGLPSPPAQKPLSFFHTDTQPSSEPSKREGFGRRGGNDSPGVRGVLRDQQEPLGGHRRGLARDEAQGWAQPNSHGL